MKRILLTLALGLLAGNALQAQITITASDMPVLSDQLRYSISLPTAGLNLTNTGANISWDYSNLVAAAQAVDTYKTASAAGYSGIGASAYGFKIADSLGFAAVPISLNNVYTFFSVKASPSRFVAEGFGAKINNALPFSAAYSDEDEWYFFPLTFGRYDSSSFKLTASVLALGTLKMQGWRKTTVDGWGTIRTPYHTTPIAVLRVRSEVNEVDTITYMSTNFPIANHTVDYKWLANGEHYPALWITTRMVGTTETPTSVRYRDQPNLSVGGQSRKMEALEVYPNPATGSEVRIKVPATWNFYVVHLYDAAGKLITEVANSSSLNISQLPSGKYFIIAESNGAYGATQFVR